MSGFARRRGSNICGSSEHRATREPKAVVCTLGTLNIDCGKAFSLLRFFVAVGQRNEVPPRTVANSDKKFSQHTTRANVSSSNPAPTQSHGHEPTCRHAQWLIVIKNAANIQLALTYAVAAVHPPRPQPPERPPRPLPAPLP